MIRTVFTALAFAGAVAAAVPAGAAEDDTVVARVNGEPVYLSDAKALYQSMSKGNNVPFDAVRERIIKHMVDMEVVAQTAQEKGLADDPEVKERLAALRKRVIQDVYLNRKVEERLTEDRLREAYRQAVAEKEGGTEVHARHILVKTEDEAKAVIDALNDGTSFEKLARERSEGPSGSRGGDLGWFKKGDMVEKFSKAAFAMEPGSVSDAPVKTRFGWHVIKVEDRRTSDAPSFEDMKPKLEQQLSRKIIDEIVADLRKDADVTMTTGNGGN